MTTGTFPSDQDRATSAPQAQHAGVCQTSLIAARVELIGRELTRYVWRPEFFGSVS